MTALNQLESERDKKFKEVAEFLGEEKAQPEDLFGLIKNFAVSFEVQMAVIDVSIYICVCVCVCCCLF